MKVGHLVQPKEKMKVGLLVHPMADPMVHPMADLMDVKLKYQNWLDLLKE